jgi:uridine kinase
VAIDGLDAAGKTTLADELAELLERRRLSVVRASIDSFKRPISERYRQGELSPRGYYEDAFDYEGVRAVLLEPLGTGGVLLFDGVFLFRPELDDCWDFRIFVQVSFEEALRRGAARDAPRFGSVEAARDRYERRYLPGERIYLESVKPTARADLILDNEDLANPRLSGRPTRADQ